MVRGTSRRVIVVDSPDTDLFEQAIFIVRNDAASSRGVSAQRLVEEACSIAHCCVRNQPPRRQVCLGPLFWSALGAGGLGLVWLLTALI